MTTWNPADKATDVELSNSNLTAKLVSYHSVRSTTAKNTGKWYFEIYASWHANSNPDYIPGIMTATADLNLYVGRDTQGWGFFNRDTATIGWFRVNNDTGTNINSTIAVPSDVLGVCVDLNANLLYATVNGVNLLGNPAAGTGGQAIAAGTWYAAASGATNDNNFPSFITANFGSHGFSFVPPAGFQSWDPFQPFYSVSTNEAAIKRTFRTVGV